MLNHIKFIGVLLICSLSLMLWGIFENTRYSQILSRGNYFFEKTRHTTNIKQFKLVFSDNNTVTLEENGGLWHIKEADDYYADFQKISAFIKLIRRISIYRADEIKNDLPEDFTKDALTLMSIDTNNQIVDVAKILPKKDLHKFHYAFLNDNSILYQLNDNVELSSNALDWVKMPLLALSYKQIKQIKSNDFDVSRRFEAEEMQTNDDSHQVVPQIQNLAQNFWYLSALDIRHAVHFNRNQYTLTKSFTITMLDGAVYQLDFWQGNGEYWLSIKLDRDKIVAPEVVQQIKENRMLFDGWFFKINPATGESIVNFVL